MAKYSASEASTLEVGGGGGFRLKADGEKARVVFLYSGPDSIDGWAMHRFTKPNGMTTSVDCPRSYKDPIDKCPACKAKEPLQTRLLVRMLNLATNEVTVWDRAASFRKDISGFMEYFNPLYTRVYEITRRGSGLNTSYTFQSLGESGLTEEQYQQYVTQADEAAQNLVRPIECYESVRLDWMTANEQAEKEQVNVGGAAPGAWGQPAPGAWGQSSASAQGGWGQSQPAQGSWGQPQQSQAPQSNWSQPAPAQQPAGQGWGQPQQTPPAQQPTQQTPPPAAGGWGQPPQGWGQAPQ